MQPNEPEKRPGIYHLARGSPIIIGNLKYKRNLVFLFYKLQYVSFLSNK